MSNDNQNHHDTLYLRTDQMNPHQNPENLAQVFVQYVRATIQVVIWATIGFVVLAGGYVGFRAVLVGVRTVLRALGI